MDKNQNTLKNALAKLPGYTPAPQVWTSIDQKVREEPLRNALLQLPEYEPKALVWEVIEKKTRPGNAGAVWKYAAAVLLAGIISLLVWRENQRSRIEYAQERFDDRLQVSEQLDTDQQYEKLKAYCEMETLVCNTGQYKRLRQEFETLHSASSQLQEAIGQYNTEPELMKQLNSIEKEKAAILNEMAKMI
jgi:hypothetical protein